MAWTKLEKREIIVFKDNAIYRTRVVGYKWFPIEEQPELYKVTIGEDGKPYQWCATSEYSWTQNRPKDSEGI